MFGKGRVSGKKRVARRPFLSRLRSLNKGKGRSNDANGVLLYRGRTPTQSELSYRKNSEGGADLIVEDESNSFSDSSGRRKYMTVVCTRVLDRESFGDVVKVIPMVKGERKKYFNTTQRERSKVIDSLSDVEMTVTERHRPISPDNPKASKDKQEFYVKLASEAIAESVALYPLRMTDVLMDTPPVEVDPRLRMIGARMVDEGARIRWYETQRSASNRYLQVHDFITGTVADHIGGLDTDEGRNYRKLKVKK